jgi:hypothetical protein
MTVRNLRKNGISILYVGLLSVMLFLSFFFFPRWNRTGIESTFGWDVSGYYWYLPSVFIYHDLKGQHFGDSIIAKYQFTPTFNQGFRAANGGFVLTYSSGMALLYSPFFAIGHLLARPLGYPADGFSRPYMIAVSMGSLLISFIGLWYFRKLLRFYFSERVTAIVLLLLVLGTNYLNYAAIDGALTHNWLFTLYVFLLLATRSFYQTRKTKYAIAIGCLCGLATLIRPSEIISVLIPLLWGMEDIRLASIRERLLFFKRHAGQVFLSMLCMMLIGAVQLAYWKYVSGHWLVYSYAEKGFSWKHPHVLQYAISYKSGWLTYTPLMVLSIIGILPFLKYGRNRVAVLCFFAINFYIVCAWDMWWYGGTGGRAMLQSYPVILFPFASLIRYLDNHKVWLVLSTPFILLAMYFNIWFTIEAHGGEGLYDPTGMTKAYFWAVAGRWHASPEIQKLKETDELFYGKMKDVRTLYSNNFEQDTTLPVRKDAIEGERSVHLDKVHAWSNRYSFAMPPRITGWLRAQSSFRIADKEWTTWKMTQFIVTLSYRGQTVKERMIRVQRLLDRNETKRIFFDIGIPEKQVDSCHILFWNVESEYPVLVDQVQVSNFH